MDERAVKAAQEANRQISRALLYQEQPDCMLDCLQRAMDSIKECQAILAPPAAKGKPKKDGPVPPGEFGMVL